MKSPSEFKGTGTILCLFDRKKRNRFVVIEINAIFAAGSGEKSGLTMHHYYFAHSQEKRRKL